MPPPVIRYAITDRLLRAADEREELAAPVSSESAANQKWCHLDRRQTEGQPQWRDLRPPATALSEAQLSRLLHQTQHLRTQSVDYLQLREKDLAPHDLLILAHALRKAIPPGSKPQLLLNLGGAPVSVLLKIAAAARFDGIHLSSTIPVGFSFESVALATRLSFANAGLPAPVVSAAVHTPHEIAAILPAKPDLLLYSPVFGKVVHGAVIAPKAGIPALAEAVRRAVPIPVLALGGVTLANTEACLAAGARGIAGVRLFL